MNPFVWLGVAAVMALIEIFSLGLITAWFVIGALFAFLAGLLGADIITQLIVFLIVSVGCLIVLRPLFIKYRKKGAMEEQSMIGQTAIVCEEINNECMSGRVKTANNMTWAAKSLDGARLEPGECVVVVAQESIKLIVERKSK